MNRFHPRFPEVGSWRVVSWPSRSDRSATFSAETGARLTLVQSQLPKENLFFGTNYSGQTIWVPRSKMLTAVKEPGTGRLARLLSLRSQDIKHQASLFATL